MTAPSTARPPGTARRAPRLAWPDWPAAEEPGGFPIVASLAPLVAAGVIWAITRSPFALLFAVAAPLAALGGLLDRRLRRRRRTRRAEARIGEALGALRHDLERAVAAETERLDPLAPDPHRLAEGRLGGAWSADPGWLRVGRGTLLVTPLLDDPKGVPDAMAGEVAELSRAAERIPDAPVLVPLASVGVVGPRVLRDAALRSLAVQLAAIRAVRGADPGIRLAGAERARDLPPGLTSVIRLADGGPARVESGGIVLETEDLRVGMLSVASAAACSAALPEPGGADGPIPDRVELAALAGIRPGTGLATPLGIDAVGAVVVDLVRDGPHAIVGGTTGSGKSELLLAWIAGLAERYPPHEAAFLLVDFKGGSTFAALAGLPHVVGIVSDLDPGTARRATVSLRTEVLRRERALAEAGARDVADVPGLGRLVVVVDEYAALVEQHPDLHATIADLTARGRSLGIHLVLCTQRPAGVIRDSVLANAGLRISLRVHDAGDSRAVVGTGDAAELPAHPPGRAILRGADGRRRTIQCAVASPGEIRRIGEHGRDGSGLGQGQGQGQGGAEPDGPVPFRPWAEPLPTRVDSAELERDPASDGVAFGLVDLPAEQRLGTAAWDPRTDGNLLVLGGRGAGTSTALATLAAGCGARAVAVPPEPADAWAILHGLLADDVPNRTVATVDDVDLLLDALDDDARPGFVRLLAAVARGLPVRGGALVLGASRLPAGAGPLLSRVDSRLLLALPDREQHVTAGGNAAEWAPRRPPGRGWWHGHETQVAMVPHPPDPRRPTVPSVSLGDGAPLGIATPDPAAVAARLRAAGRTVAEPGDPPDADVRVVRVGDPEDWSAAWGALEGIRREGTLLLVDCTARDLRALARVQSDPPPLDPRRPEAWRVRGRAVERVRTPWLARA